MEQGCRYFPFRYVVFFLAVSLRNILRVTGRRGRLIYQLEKIESSWTCHSKTSPTTLQQSTEWWIVRFFVVLRRIHRIYSIESAKTITIPVQTSLDKAIGQLVSKNSPSTTGMIPHVHPWNRALLYRTGLAEGWWLATRAWYISTRLKQSWDLEDYQLK